jgi:hypothetical protein
MGKKDEPEHGYLYAVQAVNGGEIKIGWSRNPQKRLAKLQGGNPEKLELKWTAPSHRPHGDRDIHMAIPAEFRCEGEWHENVNEVRKALKDRPS